MRMKVHMLGADYRYDKAPAEFHRRTSRTGRTNTGFSYPRNLSPDYSSIGVNKEEKIDQELEKAKEKKKSGAGDYIKDLWGIAVREGVGALKSRVKTDEEKQIVEEVEQSMMIRNLLIAGGIGAAAITVILIAKRG